MGWGMAVHIACAFGACQQHGTLSMHQLHRVEMSLHPCVTPLARQGYQG